MKHKKRMRDNLAPTSTESKANQSFQSPPVPPHLPPWALQTTKACMMLSGGI